MFVISHYYNIMLRKIIFGLFACLLIARPFISSLVWREMDLAYSFAASLCGLALFLLNRKDGIWRKNPVLRPLLVLLFAVFVSTAFSKNIDSSVAEFYKYGAAAIVFLAVSSMNINQQKKLIAILLAGAGLVALLALQRLLAGTFHTLDYLKQEGIRWEFAYEYLSRGRAFMPFAFPADLGGYLILFIPLSFFLLRKYEQGNNALALSISVKNLCLLTILIPSILGLFCTQSIGAIASLTAATCVFSILQRKQVNWKLWALCGWSAAALFGFVFFLRNLNPHFFNLPIFSLTNRLTYWEHALDLIACHPFVGFGPGNYPFFKGFWAHNALLHGWVQLGVIGAAAICGLAITTIKTSLEAEKTNRAFVWGLWVGNLAFFIHNIVDSTLFRPEVSLQWWVMAAVLGSFARLKQEPKP